jgi:hypothetical protein
MFIYFFVEIIYGEIKNICIQLANLLIPMFFLHVATLNRFNLSITVAQLVNVDLELLTDR